MKWNWYEKTNKHCKYDIWDIYGKVIWCWIDSYRYTDRTYLNIWHFRSSLNIEI